MQITLEEQYRINTFINNVFNFYNGKINVTNKAKLIIDWAGHWNSPLKGGTRNPNIILIYPRVICEVCNNLYNIYYELLATVIHELYHMDQDIDYIRYLQDVKYNDYIENAAEVQMLIYMANHQNEIAEVFGLQDKYASEYGKILRSYDIGVPYIRRTYQSHVINMIKEIITSDNDVLNTLKTAFMDNQCNIDVILSDIRFYIKIKNMCMPIEQLNDLFYDKYFKYNYRGANVSIEKSKESNDYILTIGCKVSNIMCKIIK